MTPVVRTGGAGADLDHLDGLARGLARDVDLVSEVRDEVHTRIDQFLAATTELRPRLEDHRRGLDAAAVRIRRLRDDVDSVRDALAAADRGGVAMLAATHELQVGPALGRLDMWSRAGDATAAWTSLDDTARGLALLATGSDGVATAVGAGTAAARTAATARVAGLAARGQRVAGRMWSGSTVVVRQVERAGELARGIAASPAFELGGRALGVVGVVGDGLAAGRALEEGRHGDALLAGAKVALGVAAFVPGPVAGAAAAISVGIAVYENRAAIAGAAGRAGRKLRRSLDGARDLVGGLF